MAQAKGYGDPRGYNAPLGTETYIFKSNGIVPNSSLPLIVRRGAIPPSADDPAKAFKATFAKNGWTNAWLDSIHSYHHYHPNTHEVLGIVSGSAQVRFGGEDGETVAVTMGDVVVTPAGVAHALLNASDDFAVVGYTLPRETRSGFGALHLAIHEEGELVYAGRVGRGWVTHSRRFSATGAGTLVDEQVDWQTGLPRVLGGWVDEAVLRRRIVRAMRSAASAPNLPRPTRRASDGSARSIACALTMARTARPASLLECAR